MSDGGTWIEHKSKDTLPREWSPTNDRNTLLVRELLEALDAYPEATVLDLGFGDSRGFDGGLSLRRAIFMDNKVYLCTESSFHPRGLPKTPNEVSFKDGARRQRVWEAPQYPNNLGKPGKLAAALRRGANDSDYVYLAVRRNFSKWGVHRVIPLVAAGLHVYTNFADGDEKRWTVDTLSFCIWAEVCGGEL